MLILSRTKGESIVIADGKIKITVLKVRGDKVLLGIDCHKDIPIHRSEIWAKIQQEQGQPLMTKMIENSKRAERARHAAD